jgi:murein L,D-transpeptidase YafK
MAHYLRIRAISAAVIALSLRVFAVDAVEPIDAEQLLEKAMVEIRAQKNQQALQTLNQLIQHYPDFQLAQLVRADLLYAQGNLLAKVGQPIDGTLTKDLQSEAKVRLKANKTPPAGKLPDYVMSLPSWLSHLITIDLAESRAYLFDVKQSQLQFVTSYYFTQGKLGAGKEKEGDKRTPIGAYQLMAPIPAHKLTSFYGAGALPLDYPNFWDKRKKRTGHGIWLHGTPIGQYSRPPLASDGCVVFANDDLQKIMARLDWQKTLVIIDSPLRWEEPELIVAARQHLMRSLDQWRQAWLAQDIQRYMRFYSEDFVSGGGETRKDWQARKGQLFSYKLPHEIAFSDIFLYKYPGEQQLIVSVFTQTYHKAGKTSVERKRIWWQWQDDMWKILTEELIEKIA